MLYAYLLVNELKRTSAFWTPRLKNKQIMLDHWSNVDNVKYVLKTKLECNQNLQANVFLVSDLDTDFVKLKNIAYHQNFDAGLHQSIFLPIRIMDNNLCLDLPCLIDISISTSISWIGYISLTCPYQSLLHLTIFQFFSDCK